jgi:hypothetical protein
VWGCSGRRQVSARCYTYDYSLYSAHTRYRPIAAYAKNGLNILGHFYHVVLCKPWFLTSTPDELYKEWKNQPKEDVAMDFLEVSFGYAELCIC